jgi:hypothetical protein
VPKIIGYASGEQEIAHRIATTRLLLGAVIALDPGSWSAEARAEALLEAFDPALATTAFGTVTPELLRSCADVLAVRIERMEADPPTRVFVLPTATS